MYTPPEHPSVTPVKFPLQVFSEYRLSAPLKYILTSALINTSFLFWTYIYYLACHVLDMLGQCNLLVLSILEPRYRKSSTSSSASKLVVYYFSVIYYIADDDLGFYILKASPVFPVLFATFTCNRCADLKPPLVTIVCKRNICDLFLCKASPSPFPDGKYKTLEKT